MITADGIARRLDGLDGIGVGAQGVMRMAWSAEDSASRAWFAEQAGEVGLAVQRDPAGNLWACPDARPPWWAVGSHLDSVRGGGRFDGPLGVACGFELAASSAEPIAVLSFADEEGARFNTPTFGSKALAGKLDIATVMERHDDQGVALGEAMRASGVEPAAIADAPRWMEKLAGFVEIHIDQTTELARAGAPVGIVRSLASRRRLEVDLRGRADHAGTTPAAERRDALSAAAHLIVAAEELAEGPGQLTVTTSRIVAEPNAPTTIAAHVRLWLDARAPDPDIAESWARRIGEEAGEIALRTGGRDRDRRGLALERGGVLGSRSLAAAARERGRARRRGARGRLLRRSRRRRPGRRNARGDGAGPQRHRHQPLSTGDRRPR